MANFADNNCKSVGYISANTSNNIAYQSKNRDYIISIRVTNVTGADANVTIGWYDNSESTEYKLAYQSKVPANSYVSYSFEGFRIFEGDQIKIQSSAANAIHSVIGIAINRPASG